MPDRSQLSIQPFLRTDESRANDDQFNARRVTGENLPENERDSEMPQAAASALTQTTIGRYAETKKSFLEWFREHHVEFKGDPPQMLIKKRFAAKQRGKHARKTTVGIGIRFPFEGLDIYIGAFASMFIPHTDANAFVWQGASVTSAHPPRSPTQIFEKK